MNLSFNDILKIRCLQRAFNALAMIGVVTGSDTKSGQQEVPRVRGPGNFGIDFSHFDFCLFYSRSHILTPQVGQSNLTKIVSGGCV